VEEHFDPGNARNTSESRKNRRGDRMRILHEQQFQRSRTFLMTHARLLDKKLAEFYFGGGSSADVRDVLKGFYGGPICQDSFF
jgi:hypothetical protein